MENYRQTTSGLLGVSCGETKLKKIDTKIKIIIREIVKKEKRHNRVRPYVNSRSETITIAGRVNYTVVTIPRCVFIQYITMYQPYQLRYAYIVCAYNYHIKMPANRLGYPNGLELFRRKSRETFRDARHIFAFHQPSWRAACILSILSHVTSPVTRRFCRELLGNRK